MIRLKCSLLSAVCAVALLSGAALAAPSKLTKGSPTLAVPKVNRIAQPPTVTPDDWQLLKIAVSGGSVTAEGLPPSPPPTTDQHVYVLHGEPGVVDSPLPDTIKFDLVPSLQDPDGTTISIEDGGESVYVVSQEIAEGIDASESAGELTPEIEAIAEPLDDGTSASYASASPSPDSFLGGNCATQEKTVHKVIDLNGRTFNRSYDLGNGFRGTFSVTGQLAGSVTAEIHFDVKRKKVIAWCVPYGAKFKDVHAFGNATSTAGVTVDGTIAYQDSFGPDQLAKPELFNVLFWVGPIPVDIGFNLPISAGLDLSATVAGTVNYNGTHVASGSFDYTCTLDDCTGSSTFDNTSPTGSTQEITGAVSGRVKPSPYVDIGFRAYLFSESIAYAQVGVRPYLLGDLWGYTGNSCGDADGNGNTESVHALTFDLDLRIDFTGQASVFGFDPWKRTLRTGSVSHLGFFDLIGSNAMQPQLQGPGNLNTGAAGQYKVKMRSCWPYTDQVTYQVNWGDGSAVQPLAGAPATELQTSHAWTPAGTYTATATSVRDAHGRALSQDYSRNIQVADPLPLSLVVTPSPVSATYGNPITWTATAGGGDPATTKYAFFRRLAGATVWTPDVTAAVWQTGKVFTWTPTAADLGIWEIVLWVKDGNTPANANTYGFAAYANAGPVQVVAPLTVRVLRARRRRPTATPSPGPPSRPVEPRGRSNMPWPANSSGRAPGSRPPWRGRRATR